MSSAIFLDKNKTGDLTEPAGNTLIADDKASSPLYGARLTSGLANKLVMDVSAVAAGAPAFYRVRCDIVDYNIITNNRTYLTNFFAVIDCSAVSGDTATDSANEGKAIATMADRPFLFRSLDNGQASTGFRVIFKGAGIVKNGQKVNVYFDTNSANTPSDFTHSGADITFNQKSDTAPYALVNGGPTDVSDPTDTPIPEFSAMLTKNVASPTNADFKILSREPFFAQGGQGIGLKNATFRLTEYEQGDVGAENYYTLAKPTAGDPEPNADGDYVYTVKTNISNGATKAYQVVCTRITDNFDVTANIQQATKTNEAILIENKAAKISTGSYTLNGSSVQGNELNVKFKLNNAPEGFSSIKRYTHYYLTRGQVSDICAGRTDGVNGNTDFKVKFALVKAKAEALGQVHHVEAADISYAKFDSVQETTIKGLTNSSTTDENSMYNIFSTGSTLKDGQFLEGTGPDTVQFNNNYDKNPAQGDSAFNGCYVSGAPGAPTTGAVRVGMDISANTKDNGSGVKSDAADASMNNSLNVLFNDYLVAQNGSNYDKFRYAIVKTSDVQYAGASDFTKDASYHTINVSYDGTQTVENQIIMANATSNGNENQHGGIVYAYDTVNSKWRDATSAEEVAANGTSYSIKYALQNNSGVGAKTAWLPFTPSTMPDLKGDSVAGKDGLHCADPSNVTNANIAHNLWGNTAAAATWPTKTLAQTGVTSDVIAARQGLVVDDKSITVGWSLKSYNQIKKGLDASINLTGGAGVSGVRYVVYKSSATALDKEAIRTYGAPSRDLNAVKTRKIRTSSNTSSLSVSQGYDASGLLTNLRQGVRYDISFVLANANGYNDTSNALVSAFAPMGSIAAVSGLKQDPAASKAPRMSSASNDNVTIDICLNDISGVSEHGGHLITGYNVKIEQFVNGSPTTLLDFVDDSTALPVNLKNTGLNTGGKNRNRAASITTTSGSAIPGYPLKVSVRAEARAKTSDGSNAAEADNLLFNKNRKSVIGAVATANFSGPKLFGTAHDEVRGLSCQGMDEKIVVSFQEPENGGVINNNLDAPVIRYYEVVAYDMSLNINSGSGALDPLNIAHGATKTQVQPGQGQASDDSYQVTMSGLKNGGAYLVAVHTRWGYGVNKNMDFTTAGIYSSAANNGAITNFAKELANGTYKWYQNSDPNGQGTPVAVAGTPNPLPSALASLIIPGKEPTITYTAPNSLVIKNNGIALTDALLIQLSPTPSGAGSNAFSLDLETSNRMTDKRLKAADGQTTAQFEHTVKSTTLGTNWANEQNIVIAANSRGVEHKIIG